jgi:hypothetical protein
MPSLKLIKFDLMYFKKKLKSILNRYKALFNLQCYIRRRQFYGQVKAREKVLKLNNSVWGAVEIKKKVNQLRIYEEGEKTYKIKAIWLGADPNQDQVGFLQELKSIVDLKIFKNIENQPCLYYKQDDPDAAVKNSISLFKLLEEVSCELVIGQFWPELIDLNYVPLHQILKNKNIRVICIAMDDFMPERWLPRRNGIISGPAGHGESVSLYATSDLASVQRYYKLGLNACYLPFGCTLNLRQNARERDIDVLFVGSNYGRRGEVIAFLRKNGIQVTSYGLN